MEDYPRTLGELEHRFATEEACYAYLVQQQALTVEPVPYRQLVRGVRQQRRRHN